MHAVHLCMRVCVCACTCVHVCVCVRVCAWTCVEHACVLACGRISSLGAVSGVLLYLVAV